MSMKYFRMHSVTCYTYCKERFLSDFWYFSSLNSIFHKPLVSKREAICFKNGEAVAREFVEKHLHQSWLLAFWNKIEADK